MVEAPRWLIEELWWVIHCERYLLVPGQTPSDGWSRDKMHQPQFEMHQPHKSSSACEGRFPPAPRLRQSFFSHTRLPTLARGWLVDSSDSKFRRTSGSHFVGHQDHTTLPFVCPDGIFSSAVAPLCPVFSPELPPGRVPPCADASRPVIGICVLCT